MANRYAHIDVDFLHKGTARKLREQLGPMGPLVFLALILASKNGNPPGTFEYPSDVVGWRLLGIDPEDVPFTLDEFTKVTGQCKQTAIRRRTHGKYVVLTRYEHWQKDASRLQARSRKSRYRAQNTRDNEWDTPGTEGGTKSPPRTRTRTTPISPHTSGTTNRLEPIPHRHQCPYCTLTSKSSEDLEAHVENMHQGVAIGTIG